MTGAASKSGNGVFAGLGCDGLHVAPQKEGPEERSHIWLLLSHAGAHFYKGENLVQVNVLYFEWAEGQFIGK